MKSIVFRRSCIALVLFLAQSLAALAQTNAPPLLPPAALEALNKGVIAAKVPDYMLAIRFFEVARKLAPQAPVVYLNLGLAESRIPGRELRALAWFGAYLAANPNAPNAAAVKEQMAALDVGNQAGISRLLTALQATASQLSDKEGDQSSALWQTAGLWLDSGDVARAQKAADLIRLADFKSRVLTNIAEAKFEAGDLAGAKIAFIAAQKTADRIDTEPSFGLTSAVSKKSDRQVLIVQGQAKIGDIAAAQKTADLIKADYRYQKSSALTSIAEALRKGGDSAGAQKTLMDAQKAADQIVDDPWIKRIALSAIAEVQINAREMAAAQKTLASAFRTADLIEVPKYKSEAHSAIAAAQAKSGDVAGALKTLASAQDSADRITDVADKSIARSSIAEAQTLAGDIAGAKKSLILAQDFAALVRGESFSRNLALSALAKALARSGDIAGAQKNAELIRHAYLKVQAQQAIVEAQAMVDTTNERKSTSGRPIQSIVKASDWLKRLDDSDEINDCAMNTAPFLDLAAYLKSLPPSNDPEEVFRSLNDVAEKIVKAQVVVSRMLHSTDKR